MRYVILTNARARAGQQNAAQLHTHQDSLTARAVRSLWHR